MTKAEFMQRAMIACFAGDDWDDKRVIQSAEEAAAALEKAGYEFTNTDDDPLEGIRTAIEDMRMGRKT